MCVCVRYAYKGQGIQHLTYLCSYDDEDPENLPPPRVFCDICEVFDQHDTDECPLQVSTTGSDSPPPSATTKSQRAPGGSDRPYCSNCESEVQSGRAVLWTFCVCVLPKCTCICVFIITIFTHTHTHTHVYIPYLSLSLLPNTSMGISPVFGHATEDCQYEAVC